MIPKKETTKSPWQTLSGEDKYENPWIKVTEYQVVNPSGGKGIYGKVHFKNIAVGVIPIDEDGNTWLVGQHRYTLDEYSWEICEGGCKIGAETPLEAAKRELAEETGLVASEWQEILKLHTSNSVTDEVGYAYIARGLTEVQAEPEETEDLALRKLPLKEAVEMVMRGEITDGLSMVGLLIAEKMKYEV